MLNYLTTRAVLWVSGSLIAVLLVLLGAVSLGEWTAKRDLANVEADLVTTNQAWGACKADLSRAQGEIELQTSQVLQWQEKAAATQRAADARVAKARADAARYRTRAAQLAALQTTAPDRCAAAAALYVETIGEDLK